MGYNGQGAGDSWWGFQVVVEGERFVVGECGGVGLGEVEGVVVRWVGYHIVGNNL